jgi:hypothetical protein
MRDLRAMVELKMDLAGRLLAHLPHEASRALFRVARPTYFNYLKSLRNEAPGTGDRHTLQPYLATKSVFVHVPKCAGISMLDALYGGSDCCGHLRLQDYRLAMTRREYGEAFKFGFVRNPWDRLFSGYRYLKRGGRRPHDKHYAGISTERFDSFEDFVLGYLTEDIDRRDRVPPHFRSQSHFLCIGRDGPPGVDFIGRFERLDEDFIEVGQHLGVLTNLPKHNARSDGEATYKDHYTEKMQQHVSKTYARDIFNFGYEF